MSTPALHPEVEKFLSALEAESHRWFVDDALIASLTWIGSEAGHEIGDYLVALDLDARRKQGWAFPKRPAWPGDNRTPCQRVRDGQISLTRHVLTYALAQAATRWTVYRMVSIRPPAWVVLLSCLVEAVSHGVIDHGLMLDRFAKATGKDGFARLGAPRHVKGIVEIGMVTHDVVTVETDEHGNTLYDENGEPRTVSHDNPTLGTGRWAMDQALHRSLQFLLGLAVTVCLTRRARRRGWLR
ncbi:hypothetical protein ABT332_13300 [Saccharomonospora azurea]|uniref:hypothetical protein n=1 Tax=Saccharomonospora azurea TaxID=40988 RepID=UPI0033173233